MKDMIRELISKNGLVIAVYFVLALIVGNSVFAIFFRNEIVNNSTTKELVLIANDCIDAMNSNVNLVDMGLRGYIIDQDENFLTPYQSGMNGYQKNLDNLRAVLEELGYNSVTNIDNAESAIQDYMRLVQDMVAMVKAGDIQGAIEILKRDPGYDAWLVYNKFEKDARSYIDELSESASKSYTSATVSLLVIQIGFLIIASPVLLITVSSFRREKRFRKNLFKSILKSNNDFIFHSGEDQDDLSNDEKGIINLLISNLKRAVDFISRITDGDYEIAWQGISKSNAHLNSENIAGKLINMRDQMKKVKAEDEKRIWTSQGLSDFAAIIRKNQHDFQLLSVELITNIVRYLNVQLGGLFILNDEDKDDIFLELKGCYAFERVKTIDKRIYPGKGLVGQCFLEKETIYMTNVPQDFVNITSGLGDARPDSILIVPLKLNDRIEGVIELASLQKFEDHEIEFMEKLGETLASAISTVRTSQNTNVLLEQTQQQAEEMRAQEEEMRQNMEELQATQEQMHRKNEEVEELLRQASEREEKMKDQNVIIQQEKAELETEKAILGTLMELLPERITIKDHQGKYLKMSEAKYKTLREQGYTNMIGKSDKDIFGAEHFEKSFLVERELMKSQKPVLNVEEKIKISADVSIWGLTSRVPFVDSAGKVLGTIAITKDITKEKTCQEELEKLKKEA